MIQDKTKSSMMFYMKKMRISRDSSLSDRKIPLLIGDETGKDMPYTESATLRSQQLRIRNLLKLVDYLRITAKTNLLINLVTFLSTEIKNILAIYSRDSKAIVNNAWFDVHISQ